MANVAIIFAGGTGKRMNTRSKPKQFLELHGKPILVYTLEEFNNHSEIDGIILVIIEDWIEHCKKLVEKYHLNKVKAVVGGGDCVKKHRTAITVTPAIETITIKTESGEIGQIIERSRVEMARAPQSFYLKDILEIHKRAEEDRKNFIDSASMMQYYGYPLYSVDGLPENIKITTPNDFYTFRALVDARENLQIFGF